MNWGEYNLTRMRGYLHPQVTGDYRFWIASDNSSELWLSTDASPLNARRIAVVPRLFWVDPHQWNKYPSQQSGTIQLKAGETYYIEALQEQTAAGEHLSVAWQEPAPGRSAIAVINGRYLTPWSDFRRTAEAATNGILREYWTNYPAGSVEYMAGARPFESALTVEQVCSHIHGPGVLPKPERLRLDKPLTGGSNYRWVVTEGMAKFTATEGDLALFEVSDGQAQVQVCPLYWSREKRRRFGQLTNAIVRVEGVCEAAYDLQGTMTPGRIWASAENSVLFTDAGTTNEFPLLKNPPIPTIVTNNPVIVGYFETFGVVTFNDRVFDKDCIFIQEGNSVLQILLDDKFLKSQLRVGRSVGLGGQLASGRYPEVIEPFFVKEIPQQSMPVPVTYRVGVQGQLNLDHRWTEFEGIVHSVNTNGISLLWDRTARLVYGWGRHRPMIWPSSWTQNFGPRCVDAGHFGYPAVARPLPGLRGRGGGAAKGSFGLSRHLIADVLSEANESSWSHRVRVVGEVTYSDKESFFVQDASGGIRVLTSPNKPTVKAGEPVENGGLSNARCSNTHFNRALGAFDHGGR